MHWCGIVLDLLGRLRGFVYRKVCDRASYAFALVSLAAALDVDD